MTISPGMVACSTWPVIVGTMASLRSEPSAMPRLAAFLLALSIFGVTRAAAEPCVSGGSVRGSAHLDISRDAAWVIVEHLAQACAIIDDAERARPNTPQSRVFAKIARTLSARILSPIYDVYPDLRSAQAIGLPALKAPDASRMGSATAAYLFWWLTETQKTLADAPDDAQGSGALLIAITLAMAPIYANDPKLKVGTEPPAPTRDDR